MRELWKKTYYGFEDFADCWRDVHEAVDPSMNPGMNLPVEFAGALTVTILYTEASGGARSWMSWLYSRAL